VTAYALDAATVASYLSDAGIPAPHDAVVEALSGGVSNDVLAVSAAGVELVVKQALPQLRVADEWLATPARIGREARALQLAGSICPGSVPDVVHLDAASHVLVMSRAARGARVWKAELLAGRVDEDVAARVGELTGRWHAATLDDPRVAAEFGDLEPFVQLRVDPFHRTVAARHPHLAARIEELAASLLRPGRCLVHGDLSPKNMLVGAREAPAGVQGRRAVAPEAAAEPVTGAVASSTPLESRSVWVIDWEVAHFGDPTFDLAFLLCHLRCKAAHRPGDASRLGSAAARFLEVYAEHAPAVWAAIEPAQLAAQTACLLLARVDGKSPAEYLDEHAREAVRRLAIELLSSDEPRLDAIFDVDGALEV
jgi:aminoglycoside phosphotransferase (APT) family kinase protein